MSKVTENNLRFLLDLALHVMNEKQIKKYEKIVTKLEKQMRIEDTKDYAMVDREKYFT